VDDADAAKARQPREKGITATDIAKIGCLPRDRVPPPLRWWAALSVIRGVPRTRGLRHRLWLEQPHRNPAGCAVNDARQRTSA